jgi:hypothetical protein
MDIWVFDLLLSEREEEIEGGYPSTQNNDFKMMPINKKSRSASILPGMWSYLGIPRHAQHRYAEMSTN